MSHAERRLAGRSVIHRHTDARRACRRERGATVVEALVAFAALAGSGLAAAHLHASMRLSADLARERSEAVRLGDGELEALRAFASASAPTPRPSFDALADAERTVATGRGDVVLTRRVVADDSVAGVKVASVDARWTDRRGTVRHVELATSVAAVLPLHAGALGVGPGAVSGATRGALGRAPSVPIDAAQVGGGRSAWKPSPAATLAFVFDDASGEVVARCEAVDAARRTADYTPADLARCVSERRLVVEGTIRFASTSPPTTATSDAASLPTDVAIDAFDGARAAPPVCVATAMKTIRSSRDDGSPVFVAVAVDAAAASFGLASWTDTGDRYTSWRCLVAPRSDGRWSGRAVLVPRGWRIGRSAGAHRVCRYATDFDGSGAIDANIEHPSRWRDVSGPLVAQNFLVIAGTDACPTAADPPVAANGLAPPTALARTEPHQP